MTLSNYITLTHKGHHYGNQGHKERHWMKEKGQVVEDKLQVAMECCQWSVKPGMGKGLAKSSTRWRSSAIRDAVAASSSRKALKLAKFPCGGERNHGNKFNGLPW